MPPESTDSKLPLEPVKESNIDALISAYIAQLGIPYLSLKYQKVEQILENGPVVIRHLLDFFSEGGKTPCDVTKEIASLGGKVRYRISTYSRQLPRRKDPPLSLFKKEFPEDYALLISASGFWQESTEVLPTTSPLAFALDSFAKWPAWLLVNTSGPLSELKSSDVNDHLSRVEGELLGIRREMADELFPCKIIRFNQDIIKITRDQLVMGPQESLFVDFELGPFGYQYLSANPPIFEYDIWGADSKPLVTEAIPLAMDSIKYGIRLPRDSEAVKGKEIYGSSLKLLLGKTLVDKMEGFYIRNIRVEMKTT
jgi:hypothetical protein